MSCTLLMTKIKDQEQNGWQLQSTIKPYRPIRWSAETVNARVASLETAMAMTATDTDAKLLRNCSENLEKQTRLDMKFDTPDCFPAYALY